MSIVNLKNAHLIVQILEQYSCSFCVAPGSRNTPLVLAIAESKAKKMVHFDERGLGFYALGYAKATKKTVVIVVTSGTALGNLMPAVMEAHKDHQPLILLTADRPSEEQDMGANQTIDQVKMFQNYVEWQSSLLLSDKNLSFDFLKSWISHAFFKCKTGPVHLNVMLREETHDPNFQPSFEPFIQHVFSSPNLQENLHHLQTQKGLILAGKKEFEPLIYEISKTLKWPIFADILSHTRNHPNVIRSFHFLCEKIPSPEVILHFGESFVSKNLLTYLKKAPFQKYVHIQENPSLFNPTHRFTHFYHTTEKAFCNRLLQDVQPSDGSYLSEIQNLDQRFLENTQQAFETKNLVEGLLTQKIKVSCPLFFANSMPIRYADFFFYPKIPTPIFANRGVSGIDGNIATIAGIAKGCGRIAAFLGDLSVLHDLNSLALFKKTPPIFLYIFNNLGGGIFSHLPICGKTPFFQEYFQTKHTWNFQKIAEQFEICYEKIDTLDAYINSFQKINSMKRSCIFEVPTNACENVSFMKNFKIEEYAYAKR